ncbi:hypothetical protein DVA86_05250 [Streptomyces armeniacus]|uniref:Uncharacterized protein n=1 Tax=Streptomyces armeniacus TaxID=83291 RepID=A0A345XKI4_9ACTN|nr:hypothetical protein [Streptomyces armeniacus]AXK32150.1 hypothetical protein DVA86_05250 [Streptomyces armeniacus]
MPGPYPSVSPGALGPAYPFLAKVGRCEGGVSYADGYRMLGAAETSEIKGTGLRMTEQREQLGPR